MHSRILPRAVLAALIAGTPLAAQLNPGANATATPAREDAVQLSAFTVSDSKDVGYTATNTLAGTRLNTPLKDVGTSISIVTKEFLNDIAAHDSTTLLPYTVGTEIGGPDGNFAGGSIAGGRANQAGARAEPERNQRVRGLASAELTRDYFLSDIPFDGYNTERVTINRGPNALLFGIGSPGGVVNNSTLAPVFGSTFYEAKLQVGQRHSHRESFDLNRELIPRRVAVRVAGLNKRAEYRQRPAWERDQRVFGAITAVLAENKGSRVLGPTTLRANAEYGDIAANPPSVTPPSDAMSSWWSLPSRDLQQYTGTVFPAYYDNGTFVPRATIDGRTQQSINSPTSIPNFLQFNVIYPQAGRPTQGLTDPAFRNLAGGQGRILWSGVPGRIRFDIYATNHAFATGSFPGFDVPSLQDRRIFDFYNQLFSGETNRVNRDFQAQTVTLEQALWGGRAGLEVTYDYQRYRNDRLQPFNGGSAELRVDINRYLGNDQPNPNLGRPYYVIDTANTSDSRTDREAARATAFVTLDGRDLLGKGRAGFWFGRHTLTGMYFDNSIETRSRTFGLTTDAQTIDLTTMLAGNSDNFRRQIGSAIYVGPSLLNTASFADVRLERIPEVVLPQHGDRYEMFYFDPNALPAASRSVRSMPVDIRRFLRSGNIGRREIGSGVASLQSYLLDSHLVTIVGLRRDRQRTFERVDYTNDSDPRTSDRLLNGDFDAAAIRLREDPSDIARGDTLTWSVVGRYPARLLGRLPWGADLRVFANRSENFSPVGVRRDVYNNLQAPPTGTTKEYGFMFELFEGKISARVNHFETAGTGFTNPALQGAVNTILGSHQTLSLQRLLDAETAGFTPAQVGLIAAGVPSFAQAYQEIINFLPEPTRTIRNLRIETLNGVRRFEGNPISGAVGTSSFVAKGWELDLTGNPTRGLRVSLNVAQQNTVKSDIAPELRKFAAEMRANIDKSPMRNVFDSPTLGETNTHFGRFENNVTRPIAAEVTKEGTKSLEQREWRVNAVVSYDLGGRLRGWGIGAGVRWQSEVATGYPNYIDGAGIIQPDLSRPFFGEAEFNGDGWLSYKRRILRDRVAWRVQLNVRNLIGSDDLIPVSTNPDGRTAIVRIPPDRQWFVTNTFRF
ncbi:MAG: TonB-dependent receptor plug domain-containing protein [Opitutaceae bacterium]